MVAGIDPKARLSQLYTVISQLRQCGPNDVLKRLGKERNQKPGRRDRITAEDVDPAERRLRLVTMGWLWLAALSLLYLGVVTQLPASGPWSAMTAGVVAEPSATEPATSTSSRKRMLQPDAPDDIASRDIELAELKKTVANLQSRNAILEAELEAVNEALTTATGSIAKGVPRETAAAPPLSEPTKISTVVLPLPEDGFGDMTLARSPIPIARGARPTRTYFAVELASGETVKALKATWKQLGKSHRELFTDLKPRKAMRQKPAGSGTELVLLAGPFPNAAEAARLCARLRAKKLRCAETVYGGDAL